MDDTERGSPLTCNQKLAFDNKQQAEASAVVVKYQHGTNVKAYFCDKCGLWHLASKFDE